MGVHAAPVQIHCMGIEKVIPRTEDLAIFTRLLARSATGQPVTTYTSHYRKPKAGGQMHVVIVDNGRSKNLGNEKHRNSLKCIRCGACMNTCPVFRRSGGHSYGYVIPGPIGSILAPGSDINKYNDLPFASSLCGSCTNVCPVKIDIHRQLYNWRQEISERKLLSPVKSYSPENCREDFIPGRLVRPVGKDGQVGNPEPAPETGLPPGKCMGKGQGIT